MVAIISLPDLCGRECAEARGWNALAGRRVPPPGTLGTVLGLALPLRLSSPPASPSLPLILIIAFLHWIV
jgi:hypothetical protein